MRLVEPTGGAIAWLAPGRGAACVAFMVRDEADDWREVVGSADGGPVATGVAIDGQATTWRLVSRDPTACLLEREDERGRLQAWLADGCLWLELDIGGGRVVSIDVGAPVPIAVEGVADEVAVGPSSCSVRANGVFRVRVG